MMYDRARYLSVFIQKNILIDTYNCICFDECVRRGSEGKAAHPRI